MTHDLPTEDFEPGLAEAFDWRAGRTWAAFLCSALGTGAALAAIVLLVYADIFDRPSGEIWLGRVVSGIVVLVLCSAAVRVALRALSEPEPQDPAQSEPAVATWTTPAWVRSWLNFLPLGLWTGLALLPLIAIHLAIAGWPGSPWAGYVADAFAGDLVIAVIMAGYFADYLPGLLRRWGRSKARPSN